MIRAGINHHYLVETNSKKYILRIYSFQWRSQEEIQEELDFILQLKEKGQAVAYPIINNLNGYLNKLKASEGERIAVLFSFAKGFYLANPEVELTHQIGKRIADMHLVSKDQFFTHRKTYHLDTLVHWSLQEIKKRFPSKLPAVQYLQKDSMPYKLLFIKQTLIYYQKVKFTSISGTIICV